MTEINFEAGRWRFIAKKLEQERDAARAVARELLSAAARYGEVGYPPGCSPCERWLAEFVEQHSWLKEQG